MSLKDEIREKKGKIRVHRIDLMVKAQNATEEKRRRLKASVAERLGSKTPNGEASAQTDTATPGPPGPFVSGDKASIQTHGPGAEETASGKVEEDQT